MTTTQEPTTTTKTRKFRWKTHSEEQQRLTAKAMLKLTKSELILILKNLELKGEVN